MEYRSLSVVAQLIALCLLAMPALAADDSSGREAEWASRLDKAMQLQREGGGRKSAANKLYEQQKQECQKSFLVNDCRDAARREHTQSTHEARRQENEGKALERQVKREQRIDADNRQKAEAPKREAELKAREAETNALRDEAAVREQATRADKAKKADEGAKRKAADAERVAKKRADHEARVAKKMKEAEQRSSSGH
jgi:colicin import membrane protein